MMPSPVGLMGERNATLASRLARRLKQNGWMVTTAESCTGGMLTSTLTDISGSSEWFKQGWVTYSNEAKISELGVERSKFEGDSVSGAVSKDVAAAMAEGALNRSGADLAISITGIAGPSGGTDSKPVGLAYVCAFWENNFLVRSTNSHGGDRSMNKQLFVSLALETALNVFETEETGTHRLDFRSKINEDEEIPEELTLKEKHFGEPLFNRSSRCSPVVDHLSWEEYRASPSYPYPIGIRNKDFCLPSEMIAVSVEMIRQLLTLKNVEDKYREKIQKIFTDFNIEPQFNNFVTHRCTYCGEEIDLNEYSSNYASETNYIEICHRDPNACFCMGNMYWGHGECNRRQGGYTETERIEDALGLINYNPTDYSPDLLQRLKDSIDKALALHSTKSN